MSYFLPYQRKWINDRSPKRLMEKSRQIGITLCTAFDLVDRTAAESNRLDAWVSSRDEFQARLFGQDCASWARVLRKRAVELDEPLIDAKEGITARVLRFVNKRGIYCLSSNPNAQAGKRGRRVFDEFALNPDNRQLYAIGQPGTMLGRRHGHHLHSSRLREFFQ